MSGPPAAFAPWVGDHHHQRSTPNQPSQPGSLPNSHQRAQPQSRTLRRFGELIVAFIPKTHPMSVFGSLTSFDNKFLFRRPSCYFKKTVFSRGLERI